MRHTLIRIGVWTFTLLAVVLMVPLLIPVQSYKPDMEQQLSRVLDAEVTIDSLKLRVLPSLQLTAQGVHIAGAGDQGEIQASAVYAGINPGALLDGKLQIGYLHLEEVRIAQALLVARIGELGGGERNDEQAGIAIERISASPVRLYRPDGKDLGPYRLTAMLEPGNGLKLIQLGSMDDRLQMQITPYRDDYALSVKAHGWTPPLGPALLVDSLMLDGSFDATGLELTQLNISAYGGTARGEGRLTWQGGWRINGHVKAQSVDIGQLLAALGEKALSGTLSGEADIKLAAPQVSGLLDRPAVSGRVELVTGAIGNLEDRGYRFVFDSLAATASLDGTHVSVSSAEARAYGGSIKAKGWFAGGSEWRVDGHIETQSVDIEPLLAVLDKKLVSGKLSGAADVRLAAREAPAVDASIELAHGAFHGAEDGRVLFAFDQMDGAGRLEGSRLKIANLRAQAYGGTVHGWGAASWQDVWRVQGQLTADAVQVEPLLAAFGKRLISGRLTGEADVGLVGKSVGALAKRPSVKGKFRFVDGVVYKADLEKATSAFSAEGITGGETPFDEFSGGIVMQAGKVELADLKLTSAALEGEGALEVHVDKRLSGEVVVGVRRTGSVLSVPLEVAGTIDEPSLRPTKAALVGGAMGTAILGPGVGTAVGAKVGNFFKNIGNLFQGGEER